MSLHDLYDVAIAVGCLWVISAYARKANEHRKQLRRTRTVIRLHSGGSL